MKSKNSRGLSRRDDEPSLGLEDIPDQVDDKARAIRWLSYRMAAGEYRTGDHMVLAEHLSRVTGSKVSPETTKRYAQHAHWVVRTSTDDIEAIRRTASLRIRELRDAAKDQRVQLEAARIQLQLTGDLKGGREVPSMSEAERDEQMTAAIQECGPTVERWLTAAFEDPSPRLSELLARYVSVTVESE